VIAFKSDTVREQWDSGNVDARLKAVILALEGLLSRDMPPRSVVLTSIYRKPGAIAGESGIHGTWCAADISTASIPTPLIGEAETALNTIFRYGVGNDGKPHDVAFYHNAGNGYHLHLQVPPPRVRPEEWEGFPLR
jgi:hypothetical protein